MAATVPGVTINGAPGLNGSYWELPISIDAGTLSSFVPQVTPWLVKIHVAYPLGAIEVSPAVDGIAATFQHQDPNRDADCARGRGGKICLDSPYRNRTIARPGNDPVGDADERLAWHLSRAQEWVARAARGDLVRSGDPFELPKIEPVESVTVIHDESATSLSTWRPYLGKFGQVHFRSTPAPNTIVAGEFTIGERQPTIIRESALFREGKPARVIGVWWLWPKQLVIPPWQAVNRWKELREIGSQQRVDVLDVLEDVAHAARDKGRVLMMLGYPIPMRFGEPDQEVHWETVRLPALTSAPPKGFRPNRKAWWTRDRRQVFGDDKAMLFAHTENWHPARLQTRGRLPESVYNKRVAIIGCGALGSMTAELLIRAGLRWLRLIDGDVLVAGNLVRHVLSVSSVGTKKAGAVAKRLREIAPAATVEAVEQYLPMDVQLVRDRLDDADIVIDCTGTDDVPLLLQQPYWSIPRRFISASFGYGAQRLFLFRSNGHRCPADTFASALSPWLDQERRIWSQAGERIEGPGCYSPLFPARVDAVMGGAVAVVRFLEETVDVSRDETELVVLQSSQYGGFQIIKSIEDVEVRVA